MCSVALAHKKYNKSLKNKKNDREKENCSNEKKKKDNQRNFCCHPEI